MTLYEQYLHEKEKEKENVENFYKNINEIVYPFFKKNGYKKLMRRRHFSVIFQKWYNDSVLAIQYISLAGYKILAFQINISGSGIIRFFNKDSENDRWSYSSDDKLKSLLKESIEIIERENLLKQWEDLNCG